MPNPYYNPAEQESVNLKGWTGLRNNVAKERLGPTDLLDAENIDLDDAGQPSRRRGRTLKISGEFHSAYTDKEGTVWVVKDGTLGIVFPDYTFEAVQSGFGPRRVAYTEIGDMLYCSSRTLSFKINKITRVSTMWAAPVSAGQWISPVILPTPTLGEVNGKFLGAPPTADYIAYHNGRIYLAVDNVVWATELFNYDYVDKTRNFMQFEAPVTGLISTSGPLYVGTGNGCYALSGEFSKMVRTRKDSSPVIPGSMIAVSGNDLNPEIAQGADDGVLLMSQAGVCFGANTGRYQNLSGDKFWFPNIVQSAAMLRAQEGITSYVNAADTGGSPTSTARVGDYVDAEIVRFSGA